MADIYTKFRFKATICVEKELFSEIYNFNDKVFFNSKKNTQVKNAWKKLLEGIGKLEDITVAEGFCNQNARGRKSVNMNVIKEKTSSKLSFRLPSIYAM
jgi:hypothetical protein